jgi:hypothetical protein
MRKKCRLISEKILKIWKKSRLNSENILKIQRKSKMNSEKIGKNYGRKISSIG